MWTEIRKGKMRSYLSDKKASEEKREEKWSAAMYHIKLHHVAQRMDLWRTFKKIYLKRSVFFPLSHPFQAMHSHELHSCYQTLSGCLVPLVTVLSNLGATVTNQDLYPRKTIPIGSCTFKGQHPTQMKQETLWEWVRSRELKTGQIHYSSLRKKCCWLISTAVWTIHWRCPPMS